MRIGYSRFYLVCVIAATLFAAPYFWCDWHEDDLFVTGTAHPNHPWMNQPWDLYRFSSGEHSAVAEHIYNGSFPWWTHPEWKYALWRPLSSLLLSADHAMFGHHVVGYRTDSLVWYVLLAISCGAVFRRSFGPGAGVVAVVIFVFSRSHLELMGWEAARHHIIAVTFVMAGINAHLRWRDGWAPGRIWSTAFAALGLLAGEAALSALAYWFAYEITQCREFRERVRGVAPCVVTVLIYLVLYVATKHGMHGGGSHIDPFDDPWRFCTHIPRRAVVMFISVFSGGPLWPDRVYYVVPFLVCALVLVLRDVAAGVRRTLSWFVLGSALSLAPQLGGDLGDRNLLAASIGMSALMGWGLFQSYCLLRQTTALRPRRVLFAFTIGVFAVAHLLLPVHAMYGQVPRKLAHAKALNDGLLSLKPWQTDASVLTIGPSEFLGGQLLGFITWHRTGLATRFWSVLTPACDGVIERVDENTIELVSSPRGLRSIYRDMERYPLSVGERVRTRLFEAHVLESDGGWPTRVSYRFERSVDAPDLYFVIARRGGEVLPMPAIGSRVVLPACSRPVDSQDQGYCERAVRNLFDDL